MRLKMQKVSRAKSEMKQSDFFPGVDTGAVTVWQSRVSSGDKLTSDQFHLLGLLGLVWPLC